jgi:hypothetical protein
MWLDQTRWAEKAEGLSIDELNVVNSTLLSLGLVNTNQN